MWQLLENKDAIVDARVLELLHELYHRLANIQVSSLVHEVEQIKFWQFVKR